MQFVYQKQNNYIPYPISQQPQPKWSKPITKAPHQQRQPETIGFTGNGASPKAVGFITKTWAAFIDFWASLGALSGLSKVIKVPATEKADILKLRDHVDRLANMDRSYENPYGLDRAADYIKQQWHALGFDVEEQWFSVKGQQFRNLSVSLGPQNAEKLIIGAHYDISAHELDLSHGSLASRVSQFRTPVVTQQTTRDDMQGADDNASGVAGLLELSRLLKAHEGKLKQRVELVAFTLEEPPNFGTSNMGSAHHANNISTPQNIKGMLALDMIGYFKDEKNSQEYAFAPLKWLYGNKGNYITVVGGLPAWGWIQKTKHSMQKNTTIPVKWLSAPNYVRGVDYSDHRNYAKLGIPAAMITDTAWFRNPNYHQHTDTPETLDYHRLAEVVHGLLGTVINTAAK
jgi:hypothetical protein